MPTIEELAERLETVEKLVRRLSRDMPNVSSRATTATVAASEAEQVADQAKERADTVSDKLDAHNRVLEALRKTQLEQGEKLKALDVKVDNGFAEMRGKLDGTAAALEGIADMLRRMEGNDGE